MSDDGTHIGRRNQQSLAGHRASSHDRSSLRDAVAKHRGQVEAKYGAPITDVEWSALQEFIGVDDSLEFDADDWAETLRGLQRFAYDALVYKDIEKPGPKKEKRMQWARRFLAGRAKDQKDALTLLGLNGFVPAKDIHPLLDFIAHDDADAKSRLGEYTDTLSCYPHLKGLPQYDLPDYEFEPFSLPERMVPVRFYTGLDPSDWDEDTDFWERQHAVHGRFLRGHQALQAYKELETIRRSRLARLKQLVDGLVEATGCLEADALAFLLSDRIFLLPRVRIVRTPQGGPGAQPWFNLGSVTIEATYQTQLNILVASAGIPASEVLAAYQSACKTIEDKSPDASLADRDALLIEFRRQTPKLKWSERVRQWNALGDRKPFSTAESMRVTHSKLAHPAKSGEV